MRVSIIISIIIHICIFTLFPHNDSKIDITTKDKEIAHIQIYQSNISSTASSNNDFKEELPEVTKYDDIGIKEDQNINTNQNSNNSIKSSNQHNTSNGEEASIVKIPPSLISYNTPEYPESLRRRGIEGKVEIELIISIDGTIEYVEVLKSSGYSQMDKNAIDSAYKYIFSPAKNNNGDPIKCKIIRTIYFNIE